ncbi:hypothetical protein Tco_1244378 [Tanacetum coccineum]
MPLLGTMLPPAQAAIAGESSGEAAPSNPQTVPKTITEPDHSLDHESTPPRPTTTTSSTPVNEQGPSSDPNIAPSLRPHESAPDLFTSTNVEDETMGDLSSLVSTLVQKVNTQESELNAHKLLFKEVVGKLVKKVKLLEDKLKGRKRKFVMTDSDKKEDAEQDVDLLIKLAKAAATAAADSAVPTGGSHEDAIPPNSHIPSGEFAGGSDVPTGATTGSSVDPSNKGKSPFLEEDPPVKERSFRQREEDRLGEEAARRLYEEEQADQVHANQGLTDDLLGPDVNEDNFAERMVALIAKRRREFAAQRFQDKRNKPMTYAQQKAYMRTFVKNQSSTIYTTGWTMKHVKSFSDDQLKTEFDKIRAAVAELKSLNIKRSLKRPGADLEQASSKKTKPTETPQSSVPDESHKPSVEVPSQKATKEDVEVPSTTAFTAQPTASTPKKVGTRKKRLGRKGVHPSHSTIPIEDGDPEAEHKMCIKYASDADSSSDDDTLVNLHAVVDWELLPTGLGWINVIYRKDNSRKCFTSLREILHLVTRADLMTIYGRVMTFYQDKQAAGVGLVLWGDLKVLMDLPEVNDGSDVWKNQNTWSIQSWKLYSYSGVHVLETVNGLVVHMFVDKKYPLSVNLIERMLDHQLEICQDTVGNELTTAVQLIAFLKKQISDSRRPKVHDCPCLDVDFLVADLKFMKVTFRVGFKMLLFNPLVFLMQDLSRNLKLTMSNSSLGETLIGEVCYEWMDCNLDTYPLYIVEDSYKPYLTNKANYYIFGPSLFLLSSFRIIGFVIFKSVIPNNFSSTGVDITTKTKRPQPRSNTKNDRVPSESKSSRIKNKEVEVEDHPRNLLLSKNKKHMPSECNNIKLAIRNDKSEIVYAMCQQCLITTNHDACVLNYVNDMNSRRKKQKANICNLANQTKHKAQIWKPKNVGPKERLASPKPSKPRMRLRWSPTRKMFDIKRKIIASSESNGYLNMFMVRRLGLFQAYDQESKASHQLCLEVLGNCSL